MPLKEPPPNLILASKSPRRRYLLEQAGLTFSVVPSTVDEDAVAVCDPEDYTRKLASAKARDVAREHLESWVIGADTIVSIGGDILGKPRSMNEARGMLRRLSGQMHQVYTGCAVCCLAKDRFWATSVKTDVVFKDLSPEEIDWYVHTDEPFDKAGAYAIQGLGTFLVRRINGSYTNVVGLPVCEIIEWLIREKVVGLSSIGKVP